MRAQCLLIWFSQTGVKISMESKWRLLCFFHTLKIKGFKRRFVQSDAIDEPFMEPLSEQLLKEHFNNPRSLFSMDVQVSYGNINAIKGPFSFYL